MDFIKSMRKIRKSKSKKEGTKKKKNDEKSGSRKTTKKKNKEKDNDKGTGGTGCMVKSSRSTRIKKKKTMKKTGSTTNADVEIFDTATCTFKLESPLTPEAHDHTTAQTSAFDNFATSICSLGVEGLVKEYMEQLIAFIPPGVERTIFDQNTPLKKNRYKDVVCNDKTRVILHDGRPGDYIHANYVRGTKFILTQGPLKDTLMDFWRMILQENATAICMLCELMENGKTKCEAYFPDTSGQLLTFGDIQVMCDESTCPDNHTQLRLLTVTDRKKTLKVNHYKIVTWPDKTVAVSNLSILRTHRLLRKLAGTSVIHCSAGVGRTGTFAAIEIGIQCLLSGKPFRVSDLVKSVRHCRLVSVQMDTQYLMLAEAIIDCGVSFKYIEDEKMISNIETFKKQVAEYVEAHPPPVEKPPAVAVPPVEKPEEIVLIPPAQPQQNVIPVPPTPSKKDGSGRVKRSSKEKDKPAPAPPAPPAPPPAPRPIPQSPRGSRERAFTPTPAAPPAAPAAPPVVVPAPVAAVPAPAPAPPPPKPVTPMATPVVSPAVSPAKPAAPPAPAPAPAPPAALPKPPPPKPITPPVATPPVSTPPVPQAAPPVAAQPSAAPAPAPAPAQTPAQLAAAKLMEAPNNNKPTGGPAGAVKSQYMM